MGPINLGRGRSGVRRRAQFGDRRVVGTEPIHRIPKRPCELDPDLLKMEELMASQNLNCMEKGFLTNWGLNGAPKNNSQSSRENAVNGLEKLSEP